MYRVIHRNVLPFKKSTKYHELDSDSKYKYFLLEKNQSTEKVITLKLNPRDEYLKKTTKTNVIGPFYTYATQLLHHFIKITMYIGLSLI